ncbi:TIM barrel protein [Candidatus Woesearchaeota archaeon]|nr:TIM barrel protein [Candidatus Woesearchaeota archaeon]
MIRLGPAGNCDGNILLSLMRLKNELGLQAQEVEFTFGVMMSNGTAEKVGELRKKLGLELSVHAPYYINLSSEDKEKVRRSFSWLLLSCERGHYMGAKDVVFHPGFYSKRNPDKVFDVVLSNIKEVQDKIKIKGWDVRLSPETTGKSSAFGSFDEVLRLVKDAKCGFCVDFAHLYARQQGKIDFAEVLDKLKKFKHVHSHFSGIQFTDKGERNHLNIGDGGPSFKSLAEELLRRDIDITIICESPSTWADSLRMKEVFQGLGYKF